MRLLPLPELSGIHALHPIEKTGEGGDFGEMELVGNLGDAHRGLAQQAEESEEDLFDTLGEAYLADEEEDLYWSQGALEMIEKIGAQNWLIMQL